MKLRVVSDGTAAGTHIFGDRADEEGDELRMVKELTWHLSAPGVATLTLVVKGVPVEVVGEAEIVKEES